MRTSGRRRSSRKPVSVPAIETRFGPASRRHPPHDEVSCRRRSIRKTLKPKEVAPAGERREESGIATSARQPSGPTDVRDSQIASHSTSSSPSFVTRASHWVPSGLTPKSEALRRSRYVSRTIITQSSESKSPSRS